MFLLRPLWRFFDTSATFRRTSTPSWALTAISAVGTNLSSWPISSADLRASRDLLQVVRRAGSQTLLPASSASSSRSLEALSLLFSAVYIPSCPGMIDGRPRFFFALGLGWSSFVSSSPRLWLVLLTSELSSAFSTSVSSELVILVVSPSPLLCSGVEDLGLARPGVRGEGLRRIFSSLSRETDLTIFSPCGKALG